MKTNLEILKKQRSDDRALKLFIWSSIVITPLSILVYFLTLLFLQYA